MIEIGKILVIIPLFLIRMSKTNRSPADCGAFVLIMGCDSRIDYRKCLQGIVLFFAIESYFMYIDEYFRLSNYTEWARKKSLRLFKVIFNQIVNILADRVYIILHQFMLSRIVFFDKSSFPHIEFQVALFKETFFNIC